MTFCKVCLLASLRFLSPYFFLSHTVFCTEPQLHVTEHLEEALFFWESTVANPLWNLIGYSQGSSDLPISDHGHGNAHAHCVSVKRSTIRKWFKGKEKIIIYTGLVSVHAVKNCDLGHENTVLYLALGLGQQFPRPSKLRSQFFTIWASQPENNIKKIGCSLVLQILTCFFLFFSMLRSTSWWR